MRSRAPRSATSPNAGLVLVLALLGTTCTHAPPTGTWSYGAQAVAPFPSTSVKMNGGEIIVDDFLGDRMFTSTTAIYDATSMKVKSVKQHRSCCGLSWNATVITNVDGSLDAETELCCQDGDPLDIERESRPHFVQRSSDPLLSGSLVLVPWLFVERHAQAIRDLTFFPLNEPLYWLKEVDASALPVGVPKGDRKIELRGSPYAQGASWIYYNPCTYVVDAFEWTKGHPVLRDHKDPEARFTNLH